MEPLYPYTGTRTQLHVTQDGLTTLCGVTPSWVWEVAYEGQAYPEIGRFETKNFATQGEGFHIGESFAGDYCFCAKCYKALKSRRVVLL